MRRTQGFQKCLAGGLALTLGVAATPLAVAQTRVGVSAGSQDGGFQLGVEVMTRGPVHEAYAQFAEVEVAPPPAIEMEPPPPIDEIPPDETIDSDDAEWVPGYWSFDDDRRDYIWVSGVWRVPPPDCSWVPGYWTRGGSGFEYTAGFWMPEDDDDDEIEYLPTPPRSLEEGPPGPPPSPRHVWVSGTWYFEDSWGWDVDKYIDPRTGRETRVYQKREAGYVWRPGRWIVERPDWVWTPACYSWSPRGYVFVDGHWDYPLERRGVLFAPVCFDRPVYRSREFRYSPSIAIDVNIVVDHMFTRVRTGHYYFGDYYAVEYSRGGYIPWFETNKVYRVHDPLYVQTRSRFINIDASWETRIRRDYDYRVQHVDARPVRLYREQDRSVTVVRRDDDRSSVRRVALAQPLSVLARSGNANVRTRALSADKRQEITRRGAEVRTFQDRRKGWESGSSVAQRDARDTRDSRTVERRDKDGDQKATPKSERVKIERSPVSSRSAKTRAKAPEKPTSDDSPQPRKLRPSRGKSDDRNNDNDGKRRITREKKEKGDKDDKP